MSGYAPARRVLALDALVGRYQQAIVIVGGTALSVVAAVALIRFGPVLAAAVVLLALAPLVASVLLQRPLWVASALVLVISVFPVGRISLGSLPIYYMDLLIGLALLILILQRFPEIDILGKTLLAYLFLWLPTLVLQIGRLNVVAESVYGAIRHALPITAFFIGWALFRQLRSPTFRTCLYIGLAVTSVLALMQVVPATKELMRTIHFAVIPESAARVYRVYPNRGSAFFFAPTGLSGFLALTLPFLALDLLRPRRLQHPLTRPVLALVIVGLIATVSRQWVPAAVVGLWALGRLQPRARGSLIRAGVVSAVLAAGVLSLGVIDASYIGERFGSLLNPTQDQNVIGRWEGQLNFIRYAFANPQVLLVGNGFATADITARGLVTAAQAEELRSGVTENSWLLELYNHGLAAGLIYIVVIGAVVRRGWRAAQLAGTVDPHIAGLTAIVVTGIVLHFTDRFMSETELVRAWYWLIIGWLARESALVLAGTDPPDERPALAHLPERHTRPIPAPP